MITWHAMNGLTFPGPDCKGFPWREFPMFGLVWERGDLPLGTRYILYLVFGSEDTLRKLQGCREPIDIASSEGLDIDVVLATAKVGAHTLSAAKVKGTGDGRILKKSALAWGTSIGAVFVGNFPKIL